jgi:hypothetical protein
MKQARQVIRSQSKETLFEKQLRRKTSKLDDANDDNDNDNNNYDDTHNTHDDGDEVDEEEYEDEDEEYDSERERLAQEELEQQRRQQLTSTQQYETEDTITTVITLPFDQEQDATLRKYERELEAAGGALPKVEDTVSTGSTTSAKKKKKKKTGRRPAAVAVNATKRAKASRGRGKPKTTQR